MIAFTLGLIAGIIAGVGLSCYAIVRVARRISSARNQTNEAQPNVMAAPMDCRPVTVRLH